MSVPSAVEERDLGIDDVRDARRDAVGMAFAALRPFERAFALLFHLLVELANEVAREPAIEREERDDADDEDERDVTGEEL